MSRQVYYLSSKGRIRPMPPAPGRAQLIAPRVGFQGVTAHTKQWGSFPMFGPEVSGLNDEDLISYCQQILEAGFTHGELAVSWAYREANFLVPIPGRDLTQDPAEICRRVQLMIQAGLTGVLIFMAGDGRSLPQNRDGSYSYNDPVGDTYGYEWALKNAPRIWSVLQQAGLSKYCAAVPGYDGVFYGWGNLPSEPTIPDLQPWRVGQFGAAIRAVDPWAVILLEHGTGCMPLGEGGAAFLPGGLLQDYDGILSEFSTNVHQDSTWQLVARLNPDGYSRPADQPAGDDLHPPMLNVACSRGPRGYSRYEYRTVDWTKGRCSLQDVLNDRQYLQALGPGSVC